MNLPVTDSVWAPKLTPALPSVPSSASPAGRRHARAGDDIIGFFPLVFPGVSMKKTWMCQWIGVRNKLTGNHGFYH